MSSPSGPALNRQQAVYNSLSSSSESVSHPQGMHPEGAIHGVTEMLSISSLVRVGPPRS
jgi:hypothetical protein